MDTFELRKERIISTIKALVDAGRPLDPWQKALVLEAIFARVLDQPCLNLHLLTGCTHEEAHAALDELDKRMGVPYHERCQEEDIKVSVQ